MKRDQRPGDYVIALNSRGDTLRLSGHLPESLAEAIDAAVQKWRAEHERTPEEPSSR